jgi:cytochrome P450
VNLRTSNSQSMSPSIVTGLATWPWYLRYLRDPLGCVIQIQRYFGDLCVLDRPLPIAGPKRALVFASGPSYNKLILGDPELFRTGGQGIPGPRNSTQRKLRFGLTRMQPPKHRPQRQLLMPTVLKSAVETYLPAMKAIIAAELEQWQAGASINMDREMRNVTMRIAGETLFGERDTARSVQFGSMVSEWLRLNYTIGATYCPINWPGTAYHALLKHADELGVVIRDMIRRRRKEGTGGRDMLSTLIQACDEGKAQVTEDDLLGQTAILFAASFETTATSLGWILFLLAQHPAAALKLLHELTEAAGSELEHLPFLDAVIKESMRILPPVALTLRAVTRRTDVMGFPLKKGDRVVCSHYLTHRIPELYPNPNRFEPERWFQIKPGPYDYIPFSAGPRQCIGPVFATAVMKQVLAAVLPRFRFTVQPESRIDRAFRVTMIPRYGLPMTLHKQDGKFQSVPVRGNIHEMVDL